ncbi:MAG: hypothetical protein ABI765_05055 [Gemmatimonadota bacterium]
MISVRRSGLLLLVVVGSPASAQSAAATQAPLAAAESAYSRLRQVKDRIDILHYRAPFPGAADSIQLLAAPYLTARSGFIASLPVDSMTLTDSMDRRAFATMHRALDTELPAHPAQSAERPDTSAAACRYDPAALLADGGTTLLGRRIYGCFGAAASYLEVGGERLTRLTLLARLSAEPVPGRRRKLFMALEPAWLAVNGGAVSPYRVLLAARARKWRPGERPYERSAVQFGVPADTVVAWLERVLDAWRRATPDRPVEPWDLYFEMGAAARRLRPRIPRDSLLALNRRYYQSLGADPDSLGVRYDILPREGKGPVAFTSIGRRVGAGSRPQSWVFATYPEGGFDNLEELLHETGHGIHLAGLATRPAFTDWPLSDIFTEAIADLAALEVYEPEWQHRFLGASAGLAPSLRAKYFGIMMDMAWALFEIRLERQPTADPNRVWAELTGHYLHLVPHPELSWWALRGQLIEETGYMLNYALGAIMVADLRAGIAKRHGRYTTGDPTWYGFVQQHIYRFGLERSARRVVADFLGREPTPRALLEDLNRLHPH